MAATKQRSSQTRRAGGAGKSPTKRATKAQKAAQNAKRTRAAKGTTGKASSGAGKASSGAGKATGGVAKKAADAIKPSAAKHPIRRLAVSAALKGLKLIGRKALETAGDGVRSAADRTAAASKSALDSGLGRRLPIQVSIDIAVPVEFAWAEWMKFDSFTEGIHRIDDVERDGDRLYGRTAPPLSANWEAEIVDERACADFAWRSVTGTDCAGLAAFRPLSDRLTRIELDLDVLPTGPAETLALTLHLAHRRAEAELRRFKARLEFTNPDVYEPDLRSNGSGPDNESNEKERS